MPLSDATLAELAEAGNQDLNVIMQLLTQRYGRDRVEIAWRVDSANDEDLVTTLETGAMCAADLLPAVPAQRIWFGLYPQSVCLFVGENGAGKSSLLYNLCIHAARNEPLFGVPFGMARPLKVLYVDPENGTFNAQQGGLTATKLERIDQGKPSNLYFHNGAGLDLTKPEHLRALTAYITKMQFDIVVLDPIANLFNTKDENDNAEAARQGKTLKDISRETGCCVIQVHHTGKNVDVNDGRGASARRGAADTCVLFRARGDEEQDDTYGNEVRQRSDQCRYHVVKNRFEPTKGSLYLQMAGEDRFILSNREAWGNQTGNSGGQPVTKADRAQQAILTLLDDGKWRTRAEIVQAMQQEGIGANNTGLAIVALLTSKVVSSRKEGRAGLMQYILSTALDQPPIGQLGIDPRFLVSQSPKEINKLKSVEERSGDHVDTFFGGETEPRAAPPVDDDDWR